MLVPVAAVVAVLVWLLGWGWALAIAGVAALALGGWMVRQFAAGRLTFVRRVPVGDGFYQDIEYKVASPAGGRDPASTLEMRARDLADAGQSDLALAAFRRAVELRREQAGSGRQEDLRALGSALHNCGTLQWMQQVRRWQEEAPAVLEEAVAVRRALAQFQRPGGPPARSGRLPQRPGRDTPDDGWERAGSRSRL